MVSSGDSNIEPEHRQDRRHHASKWDVWCTGSGSLGSGVILKRIWAILFLLTFLLICSLGFYGCLSLTGGLPID